MNDDDIPEEEVEDAAAPDDAASRVGAERKAKRIRRQQTEDDNLLRDLFRSASGRRFIWSVLQAGGIYEQKFACGPSGFPQPEATWFHAGQRDLVQRLHDSWQAKHFEGVHLMHIENDPRFAVVRRSVKSND